MPRCLVFCLTLLVSAGCSVSGNPPAAPSDSLREIARRGIDDPRVFLTYNPAGPSRWNPGWPWQFDLTGVAWDSNRTATAITPRLVVMAAHYERPVRSTVVFHDRRGRAHSRIIIRNIRLSERGHHADITVGLLDRELPPSIRTYPLPAPHPGLQDSLPGALLLVTEQQRKVHLHQIRWVAGSAVHMRFDAEFGRTRGKNLIAGDSGHPSFARIDGELVLMETHTSGGPGVGPFYGSAEISATLDKIAAELDPTRSIRRVEIPPAFLAEARAHRQPEPLPPSGVSTPPKPADRTPPGSSSSPRPRVPRPRVIPSATE